MLWIGRGIAMASTPMLKSSHVLIGQESGAAISSCLAMLAPPVQSVRHPANARFSCRPTKPPNDMRSIDREIGARLRSTRQVLGISQQILAKKIRVSFQQIQKYKRYKPQRAGMLVKICQ
ncbi:hypothetical protein SM0020_18612 [Sinorhizobium meliloti CCNWSX0020]|uniref:HTH cro/C1-type domain-containing protein n=1 Tax=Sinorhizobium meliloti CCNWSX0020 TaxID=1107881 RepID=H0G2N2_RHIML|nr:hypothetical protein SM0020_18612 [Sinorhizobium meliloti CCNWSX0020]